MIMPIIDENSICHKTAGLQTQKPKQCIVVVCMLAHHNIWATFSRT